MVTMTRGGKARPEVAVTGDQRVQGSPAPPVFGVCPPHGNSAACMESLQLDAEQDPCASNQRP